MKLNRTQKIFKPELNLHLPTVVKFEGIVKPKVGEYITSTSTRRCLMPARRVGKTIGICIDIWAKVRLFQQNGLTGSMIYAAPTYVQANKVFWNKMLTVLKYYDPKGRYWRIESRSTPRVINFCGILLYVYGTNNPETMEGDGYLGVWLDEAPDIKEHAWETVLRPAIADTQGYATIAGTPNGQDNWTYNVFHSPDWDSFNFSSVDGGYVTQRVLDKLKGDMNILTYKQEFLGEFVSLGDLAYYSYSDKNENDIMFNSTLTSELCFDFNVNPSTCLINQEIEPGIWCYTKEFSYNRSNTIDSCSAIHNFLQKVNFSGRLNAVADYTGRSARSSSTKTDWQIIDQRFGEYPEFELHGIRNPLIKDRVMCINNTFESISGKIKQYVNPKNCPLLHKDLVTQNWNSTKTKLDDKNGVIGHKADAAGYFAYKHFNTDNIFEDMLAKDQSLASMGW